MSHYLNKPNLVALPDKGPSPYREMDNIIFHVHNLEFKCYFKIWTK